MVSARQAFLAFMVLACTVCGMPGKDHSTPGNLNVRYNVSRFLLGNVNKKFGRNSSYTPIAKFQNKMRGLVFSLFDFNVLATLLLPFIFPAPWHPHQKIVCFSLLVLQKIVCTRRSKPVMAQIVWHDLVWHDISNIRPYIGIRQTFGGTY